jgi:hypothetical protein
MIGLGCYANEKEESIFMAMNGTGAASFSFARLDNIKKQKKGADGRVSKGDIKIGMKNASAEEKKHLQRVLNGFGKGHTIDANRFGTLYG